MPAASAFFCIIGNFILFIAIFFQNTGSCLIHIVFRIFIRQIQLSRSKRCPLFNDQAICRDMLRLQFCNYSQIIAPFFISLVRNCAHKVNIYILKTCSSCTFTGFQKLLVIMNPSKNFQLPVIWGLQADTQTVDAKCSVRLKFLLICSSRIYLNRNLSIIFYPKILSYFIQDFSNESLIQNRRSAPSNKYRGYTPSFTFLYCIDFRKQSLYIFCLFFRT